MPVLNPTFLQNLAQMLKTGAEVAGAGSKVLNPALKAYQFSQTPLGRLTRQGIKSGVAHLRTPSSNLPSHYTVGAGGSRGAYRANKGMKLMKKGGRMYEHGGREPDVNELLASLAAQEVPQGISNRDAQIGREMGRVIGTGMEEMVQEALTTLIETIGAEQAKILIDQMEKSGEVGKEAGMMMGSGIE